MLVFGVFSCRHVLPFFHLCSTVKLHQNPLWRVRLLDSPPRTPEDSGWAASLCTMIISSWWFQSQKHRNGGKRVPLWHCDHIHHILVNMKTFGTCWNHQKKEKRKKRNQLHFGISTIITPHILQGGNNKKQTNKRQTSLSSSFIFLIIALHSFIACNRWTFGRLSFSHLFTVPIDALSPPDPCHLGQEDLLWHLLKFPKKNNGWWEKCFFSRKSIGIWPSHKMSSFFWWSKKYRKK